VTKAVIPAAGLGTRLLPLTRAIPKELLPAGTVPLIQLAVEEAVAAGIQEICIVLRRGKEAIRSYFTGGPGGATPVTPLARRLAALLGACRISFAWQPKPRGLGDAMRCARDFVGQEPFLLIIPDQFLLGPSPASRVLLGHYHFGRPTILSSVVRVPRAQARLFPGVRGLRLGPGPARGPWPVLGLVPPGWKARGTSIAWGFGRTIYPPEIFPYLASRYRDPKTGEVDLWRSFEALPPSVHHRAVRLVGRPCDVGTLEGYARYAPALAAASRPAWHHPPCAS
jgi:UTP--glucose-1-phosphate uridylyltransferase